MTHVDYNRCLRSSKAPLTPMPVFLLSKQLLFPPPRLAEKDGLLAVGGDLTMERLLLGYREGIFPWYSENEPIMWWSPDPRLVLYPAELHLSSSLKKKLRQHSFRITADKAFPEVIAACAAVRSKQRTATWITDDMLQAYICLHQAGFAHSIEAWQGDRLAGGLYGIALGKCFFGESMFAYISDASKVAFVHLVQHLAAGGYHFIDCQVVTGHLQRLGAREIPRAQFLRELKKALLSETVCGKWEDPIFQD